MDRQSTDSRGPGRHINLTLDGKSAVLSDAMLGSERISVGAKGRADAETREGMVYVRWHNLTGALARQGEEHFDLIAARDKFDAYVPGKPLYPPRGWREKQAPSPRAPKGSVHQPRREVDLA